MAGDRPGEAAQNTPPEGAGESANSAAPQEEPRREGAAPGAEPAADAPAADSAGPKAAANGDLPGADSVPVATAELERLHTELEQARELVLRAQAEAQNAKRRAEQEAEKARKFALERFSSELLPVVDNLERALESASVDDDALRPIAEGVALTLRSFVDVLGKFNIEALDPQGEPFDPNLHQAMSMVENSEVEPNSVIAVMQKGYTLNGRLLRPAMVMVSKAPGA